MKITWLICKDQPGFHEMVGGAEICSLVSHNLHHFYKAYLASENISTRSIWHMKTFLQGLFGIWKHFYKVFFASKNKIPYKTLQCYIFKRPRVQGHQKCYSGLSDTQIHKQKFTNTQIQMYSHMIDLSTDSVERKIYCIQSTCLICTFAMSDQPKSILVSFARTDQP